MGRPKKNTDIYATLLGRIHSGEYPHGESFPTETELASMFKVARNTVRLAMSQLQRQGLLLKHQGRPSRVNYPPCGTSVQRSRLAWFTYQSSVAMYNNFVYFEMFRTMVEAARQRQLMVDFYDTSLPGSLDAFEENRGVYAGVFAVGLTRDNMPPALFSRLNALPGLINLDDADDLPGRHCVSIDNFQSARLAATHLLSAGARSLHVVNLKTYAHFPYRERLRGAYAALAEFGKEASLHEILISDLNSEPLATHADIENLLCSLPPHSGIFGLNDPIALFVLDGILRKWHRLPPDIRLIGFDGNNASQLYNPRLTTVAQPIRKVIETALEAALAMNGKDSEDTALQIRIPGRILPGETA